MMIGREAMQWLALTPLQAVLRAAHQNGGLQRVPHCDLLQEVLQVILIPHLQGPTTVEGDAILRERGIVVLPDLFASAGGVTVSEPHPPFPTPPPTLRLSFSQFLSGIRILCAKLAILAAGMHAQQNPDVVSVAGFFEWVSTPISPPLESCRHPFYSPISTILCTSFFHPARMAIKPCLYATCLPTVRALMMGMPLLLIAGEGLETHTIKQPCLTSMAINETPTHKAMLAVTYCMLCCFVMPTCRMAELLTHTHPVRHLAVLWAGANPAAAFACRLQGRSSFFYKLCASHDPPLARFKTCSSCLGRSLR